MHASLLSRGRLSGIIFLCLTLYVLGWWRAFAHAEQHRGYPDLSWSFVLVVGPVVSIACVVEMFRVKRGSDWWLALAIILLAPQLLGLLAVAWVFLVDLGIL
jgi:hypothetical protein